MGLKKLKPPLTLQERLECGNLTVDEVMELRSRSRAGFYEDLKEGLVSIHKIGRKSVVFGPIAKAYIKGDPIPRDATAAYP